MRVRCPHCDTRLTAPDHLRGQRGRCPNCQGGFPIVPADEAITQVADPASTVPRAQTAVSPTAIAQAAKPPVATIDGTSAPRIEATGEPARPVEPLANDDGYGLVPDDQPAAPEKPRRAPVQSGPGRLGSIEAPRKARSERAAEIADLRADGRKYLWQIRLLLLGLGLLMILYNAYMISIVNETIEGFKSAVRSSGRGIDQAKLEEIAAGLKWGLLAEGWTYLVLGVSFCVLAIWISWAPRLSTYAALGTYVGVWVLDLLMIQALFGDIALGQAIFSLGTVIKAVIVSGLWYGTRVGTEYEEQVVRPLRELREEDQEDEV